MRRGGVLSEHALPEDPLLDYETAAHHAALEAALDRLVGATAWR